MKYTATVVDNDEIIDVLCLDDVLNVNKMSMISISSYIMFREIIYCVESIMLDLDDNEVHLKLRKL